jgi:uncharacterized protein (DUF433 family)
MTIKWVKVDPLVMNGEPFCHNTRLTVRNLLEMRAAGLTPARMIAEHPELRRVGIAEAFVFAADNRRRYAEFFDGDALRGPAYTPTEAMDLPEHLRSLRGIVVTDGASEPRPAPSTSAPEATTEATRGP